MFIDNKYTRWYNSIIDRAKSRGHSTRKMAKIDLGYVELHHIIPKSLGGPNNADNLVYLSAREHFICHWLLVKMVCGLALKKMKKALVRMRHSCKDHQRYDTPITSRVFVKYRPMAARAHGDMLQGRKQSSSHVEKRMQSKSANSKHAGREYTFYHIDGMIETCTPQELETKYNLPKKSMYRIISDDIEEVGVSKSMYGWRLTPEPLKFRGNNSGSNNPKYITTTFLFEHLDGRRERCTPNELRTKYNLHAGSMSWLLRGKLNKVGGWKIVTDV
jgi:hypothetical protein